MNSSILREISNHLGCRSIRPGRATSAQVRRARIFGVIHAMAEAGNLLLLRQHALDVIDRIGARGVDGFQDAEHRFVGAAVQRPLQRPDRRSDGRVHVAERGRHHARRKGRGVQLVVGMQDERDVEGAFGGLRWESRRSACTRKLPACDSERSGSTSGLPLRMRS